MCQSFGAIACLITVAIYYLKCVCQALCQKSFKRSRVCKCENLSNQHSSAPVHAVQYWGICWRALLTLTQLLIIQLQLQCMFIVCRLHAHSHASTVLINIIIPCVKSCFYSTYQQYYSLCEVMQHLVVFIHHYQSPCQ